LTIRYMDRTLESVRKLRSANAALEHRAFHDPLTNLPNRALFAERLEHAILRAGESSVAVLFLDLDNFKTVNDTFGHATGDALLVAAAERLVECVRREDTIARLGGDEFTVLLEDMHDPSDAARMAERISEALRTPFDLNGHTIVVSTSIGIALDTDRSHRPDELLREADLAMYRAKSGGKARYEIFDTGMAERAMERLELETDLRHAVARGELELVYEPVVGLGSGDIGGVEAHVRWRHPRRGLLDAADFLHVAEEVGLAPQIGRWALEQGCRNVYALQGVQPGLQLRVNVSARLLEYPRVIDMVRDALDSTGLPPSCLRLEVPEPVIVEQPELSARVVKSLVELGVRVSVDEAGSGASSLAWMSTSRVDEVKLAPGASASRGLVRATVALAQSFGSSVLAQGVRVSDETPTLAALGVGSGQGPLYGAPMPIADLEAWLADQPGRLLAA
jgi:diguanylate cyclase (GGDEF)-like protein